MKNVTRKEIAEKLGVSVSVVSRAINNSGYVEKEKREKILNTAREMGYVRNPIAMALQQNKTRQLLFFCEDLTATYYNQMYHGMAREAKKRDYQVLAVINENNFEMVKTTMADGILFPNETTAQAYVASVGKNYHLPSVTACFDPGFAFTKAMPTVTIDNEEVINTAIDYLLSKGHKKIGITLPLSYGYVDRRFRYWRERMKLEIGEQYRQYIIDIQAEVKKSSDELGMQNEYSPVAEDFLYSDMYYIGAKVADAYLHMKHKPSAILCYNDDVAFGTIERLKVLGIGVPEDVSVMGIDGVYTRDRYTPRLTTINMYPDHQGAKCVQVLTDMLNGEKYKYMNHFKISVLEGDSVKENK